jgi:hypothetical protein
MRRKDSLRFTPIIVGKVLALVTMATKEVSVGHGYPINSDNLHTQSWNLSDGATGTGKNYQGFCDQPSSCPATPAPPDHQWRVYSITHKSANTDNKIGARAAGYESCSSQNGPWTLDMDLGWYYNYSGHQDIGTPAEYGIYTDCPSGHYYRSLSSHLFTNNNPYENQTFTIDIH